MSDTTTTDTSAIDEKKAENEGSSSSNTPNWYKFGSNLLAIIAFILIYFSFGV